VSEYESHSSRDDVTELHIVSGGVGASAELLTHTVLAQYPNAPVSVKMHPHVHDIEDIVDLVANIANTNGIILHTLVHTDVREGLIAEAKRRDVAAVDLVGPLMEELSARIPVDPIGQPGLFRKLYGQYFKRVEAIEFTVAHDDGQRSAELEQADILLIGVSRVGKTPLSMYLAMQGWKVANVPFVPNVSFPSDMWQMDRRRIVGLTIEPPQLTIHRRWRRERLGVAAESYVERHEVATELREANRFFAAHGIPVVDTTDKPIETSGTEIVAVVTHRLNSMPKTPLAAKDS
jgi:[pyruvate, water dikinase]-phosphate phosphotransferase / [pyruvate, water dikinase] kinase